jgi:hypothetical protein
MSSNQALDALTAMGIDVELVDIYDAKKHNRSIDRRICICGHPVTRHKTWQRDEFLKKDVLVPILEAENPQAKFQCQPNALLCDCKKCIPVLKVSNTKYFLKKTDGASESHALVRGLRGLINSEIPEMEWLVERVCCLCQAVGDDIVPAPFTEEGALKRSKGSEGYDNFVCQSCRSES